MAAKNKERSNEPAVNAAKAASTKRLCAMLADAQRRGTLRPVNETAQPITMEMRVKSK